MRRFNIESKGSSCGNPGEGIPPAVGECDAPLSSRDGGDAVRVWPSRHVRRMTGERQDDTPNRLLTR